MFLDAVKTTLISLTYWRVYFAGLEYVIIIFTPTLIAFLIDRRHQSQGTAKVSSLILIPIFQAIGILFFVFSVAYIALGHDKFLTWKIPFDIAFASPGLFLGLSLLIVLASIVLALLPFVGQMFSFQTLVLCGIALWMMFILDNGRDFPHRSEIDWLPGFWFAVGIIIVGAAFGAIGLAAVRALANFLSKLTNRNMGTISALISIPVMSTFGFVPFFIYAAWIGAQFG